MAKSAVSALCRLAIISSTSMANGRPAEVVILHDSLTRMDAHQYRKVSRLRRLHW
jgi:hypothetical protein